MLRLLDTCGNENNKTEYLLSGNIHQVVFKRARSTRVQVNTHFPSTAT